MDEFFAQQLRKALADRGVEISEEIALSVASEIAPFLLATAEAVSYGATLAAERAKKAKPTK